MVKAVIDVGSNSVILLVAKNDGGNWQVLHETTAVTALGEGVRSSGVLKSDGVQATLNSLRAAFSDARMHGAESTLAAGTMALRLAHNAGDFLSLAASQGTPVQVLSGEQEAHLSFVAVAEDPIFGMQPRISMIDVGGQSTELVTASCSSGEWTVEFRHSFAIGTLGLRESILKAERLQPLDLLRASSAIDAEIEKSYKHLEPGLAVSVGATGTNLVSIRNNCTSWQPELTHGQTLEYEEIARAVGWLSSMSDSERAAINGIEPGREKTLHIGALILERFLYALKVESCAVSNRGWRYALLDHPLEVAH